MKALPNIRASVVPGGESQTLYAKDVWHTWLQSVNVVAGLLVLYKLGLMVGISGNAIIKFEYVTVFISVI